MSDPVQTAPRGDAPGTRERVLEVATALMARRGFSGTSISAISRESGVMPASIYWHFESKEGLLDAVIDRAAEAWFGGADQAMEALGPGADIRSRNLAALRYVVGERPEFYRLLLLISLERSEGQGASVGVVERVRERFRERIAQHLEARIETEHGARARPAVARLARLSMLLLDGTFVAQQIDPVEGDALVQRLDDVLWTLNLAREALVAEIFAGDGEGGPTLPTEDAA